MATRAARIGLERRGIVVARRGERMVHGHPALLLGVPLEHREVDDPQRPPACFDEPEVLADLQAQRAERVVHDLGGVRAEEDEVAVCAPRALEDAAHRRIAQELENRRLQALAALGGSLTLMYARPFAP